MNRSQNKRWRSIGIAIAIPLIIGGISGFLIRDHVQIYRYLKKPPLAPPAWVFPLVWSVLYVLMGISSWRICRSRDPQKTDALRLYGSQLVLNFLWPPVFFCMEAFGLAFLILLAL